MSNHWPVFCNEFAIAPLALRHLGVGGLVPQHVLTRRTEAREVQSERVISTRRLPTYLCLKEWHDAVAMSGLFHLEPLTCVDVRHRASIVAVGEAAPGDAWVALRVAGVVWCIHCLSLRVVCCRCLWSKVAKFIGQSKTSERMRNIHYAISRAVESDTFQLTLDCAVLENDTTHINQHDVLSEDRALLAGVQPKWSQLEEAKHMDAYQYHMMRLLWYYMRMRETTLLARLEGEEYDESGSPPRNLGGL